MSGNQPKKGTEVTTKRKAEEQGSGGEAKRRKAQESTQSTESERPIEHLLRALPPPTFFISSNNTAVPTDGPPPLEHPSVFLLGPPTNASTQPQPSSNTSRPRTVLARPTPVRSFGRAQPHSLAPRPSTLPNAASNLSNHQIAAAKSQQLLQSLIQRDDEDIPLSANELYKLFCQRDDNNLTAFHRAFLNHANRKNYHRGVELIELAVRKGMPFQWILDLLFMTHGVNKFPLQLIAKNSEVMEAILTVLIAGDLGKSAALFLASDGKGRSFFEAVRQHPQCMKIFLEAFPADQQAKIIAPPVLRESEIKATRARGAGKESKGSPVRPTVLQAPCTMFAGTQPASNQTFSEALQKFVASFVAKEQAALATQSPSPAKNSFSSSSS